MNLVVQKYGGSSLASAEAIKNIAEKIKLKIDEGKKIVLVVSAMGKTTDNLINLALKITDDPDSRELDLLLSTGELVSSTLLTMALRSPVSKYEDYLMNSHQRRALFCLKKFDNAHRRIFSHQKLWLL